MSGLYRTRPGAPAQKPLGEELRALREAAGNPGWEVAAAARMDSGLLSKIENGKRLPTQSQLAAMANFFKVPVEPLEARRVAEDVKRQYGTSPVFAAVAALLHEEAGEYRVKKVSAAVNKPPQPVNKRKKT